MSPLIQLASRQRYWDYTVPILEGTFAIMIPYPENGNNRNALYKPFHSEVRYMMGFRERLRNSSLLSKLGLDLCHCFAGTLNNNLANNRARPKFPFAPKNDRKSDNQSEKTEQ